MSDTHMRHGGLDVPDGDVLVHAGDATNLGDLRDWATFVQWLGDLPHPHKVLIAGNHDICCQHHTEACRDIAKRCGVTYLHDSYATVDGLRFYGTPWVPEFGTWAFMLPRDGEALRLARAAIPQDLDVLVTHGPAYGVLDHTGATTMVDGLIVPERDGCKVLAERLEQLGDDAPRLHVFGHMHHDGGEVHVGEVTMSLNVATKVKVVEL